MKESSLACRPVFNRPEHNANGVPREIQCEGLKMQKWDISTYRAQRVDLSSCHVYSQSTVIKMLQMDRFFVFPADVSKKLVTVWGEYLSAPERCYWVL